MNYGAIKPFDIADGTGVRVSLFVSGCRHHCKGCFNPETWNFDYGRPYTQETEDEIIRMLSAEYIEGLSVLGGDPLEPENLPTVLKLIRRVRAELPKKNIWVYTGCLYEQCPKELLDLIDVLVDGEFMVSLKDISLRFRGSSNQRIIRLKGV